MTILEVIYLINESGKIAHCLSVAKYMQAKAIKLGWGEKKANEMFLLGLVHDSGYWLSDDFVRHPQHGGKVLYDTGFKYWYEVTNHGNIKVTNRTPELDLLDEADLHVSPMGDLVPVSWRLEDIRDRYGEDSIQYDTAKALAAKLNLYMEVS